MTVSYIEYYLLKGSWRGDSGKAIQCHRSIRLMYETTYQYVPLKVFNDAYMFMVLKALIGF